MELGSTITLILPAVLTLYSDFTTNIVLHSHGSKDIRRSLSIVCPLIMLHNWISEFEKLPPSIPVSMSHSTPQFRVELPQTVLREPTLVGEAKAKPEQGCGRKGFKNTSYPSGRR
ncbi:hypothetical protein B0J17DRAFT_236360 [Rhizoctonia solani]|nr:hypothetical protein B0J17DRAFT_236360 [Rhizoctonia solani]